MFKLGLGTEDGPVWREQKRFALKTLRDLGLGRSQMEEHILHEISHLFVVIDEKVASGQQPIQVRTVLSPSTSNIMASYVFGKRYDYKHPRRQFLDSLLDPSTKNLPLFH